jgi:MYXO-CTERM domain-containing protein
MRLFTRQLAQRCKRLAPLLAAPAALLLGQGQAKAILNVKIFDDGPNLKISVSGSLSQLPAVASTGVCGAAGALFGEFQTASPGINNVVCSGPNVDFNLYDITGPSGFGGTERLLPATSVSGSTFWFASSAYTNNSIYSKRIGLDPGFLVGSYLSEAIFNGRSLASEGFTATGLVGTWTIDGTSESINVCIGSGPCASDPTSSVPGPLPLLGAGAAFGWSRRLRKRIATPLSTPPQA